MPRTDDWSDSDSDLDYSDTEGQGGDTGTRVQLGVPDGAVADAADLLDAAVSRVGGHPAFLTPPPPPADAHCKNCSRPMELLIQVWCPREDSEHDRALYVWGCAKRTCQRKDGSVRAYRGLRYNEKYAAKLAQRREKQRREEEERARLAQEEERKKAAAKVNPFAMKGAAAPSPFDLGAQIFGGPPPEPEVPDETASDATPPPASDTEDSEGGSDDDASDSEELETSLADTLEGSEWASAPAYAARYLSTVAEYLPPAPKPKVPAGAEVEEDDGDEKKKGESWGLEGYENSLEVDHAFERFAQRVAHEGEQCLRYDLGGTPLPFASDAVFDKLFPRPEGPPPPVTKAAFAVQRVPRRTYAPAALPQCPKCNGPRIFECQLMPNLINVLARGGAEDDANKAPAAKETDEERRAAVMRALKGEGEGRGMEWGTCMVFTCERDCADERGAWREEAVLVQWDD
ncbi:hypothetical protein CERSUDRAFT_112597 [Gelatoporia subvermispora B]|uniref:Programmed cell death protein 2 C-terminal domain-containing protein n=1 Tax=Ceriporiopsis subvermispora (strain B) TaxID=914234 RepID=M2RK78_CERS8|nr:hypothetical protein CERSUDRAFT_112597 [Gelatoporia subvermispora B]